PQRHLGAGRGAAVGGAHGAEQHPAHRRLRARDDRRRGRGEREQPRQRVHRRGSCTNRNTPFLLLTTTSGRPSPSTSATSNCVPTPELSSITCGTNFGGAPPAPRSIAIQTRYGVPFGSSSPSGPCAQKRLPVTRSGRPSPSMSAMHSACVCVIVVSTSCCANARAPSPLRCWRCHHTPRACAELLTTSRSP